jgi:hypothetical protein
MSKQILIETSLFIPKPITLTEGKSVNGNLLVKGILATAEVKNGNGRYYAKDLWQREINKYMENVKQNRSMGELDHPESSIINLKNVSHKINKMWWDGDNVMGVIEILPTPSGNIVKSLIENKIPVGVSSRGMGSLKPMGENMMEVQDDFELIAWDFVSTPSNPGSYMYPMGTQTLNEGLDFLPLTKDYSKVNDIVRDILCSNGTCPIF